MDERRPARPAGPGRRGRDLAQLTARRPLRTGRTGCPSPGTLRRTLPLLPYDQLLADRIRERLSAAGVRWEQKAMFGGLAFLVGGRMSVAASRTGSLLVRVVAAEAEDLLNRAGVAPMRMSGRPTKGWLLMDPSVLEPDARLGEWIEIGLRAARAAG